MKKLGIYSFGMLLFFTLTGCVTLSRPTVSGALPKNATVIGTAAGKSAADYTLWFRVGGDDSVREAIKNAMAGTGADDMTNLVIQTESTWVLFFGRKTTTVRGALVKYAKD